MHFDVFTLFPGVFQPYLDSSILQRAQENGFIKVSLHNIRDWTSDRHHVTDDAPYGGGGGMVMKVEPIFAAVESALPASLPLTARQTLLHCHSARAGTTAPPGFIVWTLRGD